MPEAEQDPTLRRACQRDPAALHALVDRYANRLFGLLFRLTGRRDVAEELLQETFLRVVRTIDQYEHSGRFDAWIFRIAANLARDRFRARKRRGEAVSLDAELDGSSRAAELPGPDADPAQQAMAAEERERVAWALGQLSEPDREILLLRHHGQLSFREIAELLGVPLGTALARAHRALQRLRAALGPED